MIGDSKQSGFMGVDVVERMMVIAIIGIVLAIAIPQCQLYRLRSKAHLVQKDIEAIVVAEDRYFKRHQKYVAVLPDQSADSSRAQGFNELGWEPESLPGNCHFAVVVAQKTFTVEAICDLDEDGDTAVFGYVRPAPGMTEGLSGPTGQCMGAGVYNPETEEYDLNVAGPCDPDSGKKKY